MWRKVNIACLAGITCLVVAAAARPGRAQAQEGAAVGPLLDATHALQAHALAEGWLRDGVAPPPELVRPIPIRGLSGACVTLRLDGFQVGVGEAVEPVESNQHTGDLARLVRDATKAALDALAESLRDAELRAAIQTRHTTLPAQVSVRDIAPRIAVDVQVAGVMETILLPAEAPDELLYQRFAPGYHGLRLSDAQTQAAAVVWPASALAMNAQPPSQVVNLLSRIGHTAKDAPSVARPRGLGLQRFVVHHAAPAGRGLAVTPLVRGNVMLPTQTVEGQTLRGMTDRLAQHLESRFLTDGVLRGTYQPGTGMYDPIVAEPEEALLAAYALTRYVRHALEDRPNDAALTALNARAQGVAVSYADAVSGKAVEPSPALAALAALTLIDNGVAPRNTEARDRLVALLLKMRSSDGAFLASDAAEAPAANQTVQALATAALAAAYEQTRRQDLGAATGGALERLWAQSQRPNVNALPWLAIAQQRAGALL